MDDERIMSGETIDEATGIIDDGQSKMLETAMKYGPVAAAIGGLTIGGGFAVKWALGKLGFELQSPIVRKQRVEEVVEYEVEDDSEAEG